MIGTIDYIGRQHVYTDQSRGFAVASITGAIKNQGLEELRIRDFFLMRGNTIPAEKKTQVENIIANNVRLRDSGKKFFIEEFSSFFLKDTSHPFPTTSLLKILNLLLKVS